LLQFHILFVLKYTITPPSANSPAHDFPREATLTHDGRDNMVFSLQASFSYLRHLCLWMSHRAKSLPIMKLNTKHRAIFIIRFYFKIVLNNVLRVLYIEVIDGVLSCRKPSNHNQIQRKYSIRIDFLRLKTPHLCKEPFKMLI